MGNGKGNPEYHVAEIQPGKVLYEMDGVSEELAREAFALAAAAAACDDLRHANGGLIMKASELRTKGADELNKELFDLLKAQFSLAYATGDAAAFEYQPASARSAAISHACVPSS